MLEFSLILMSLLEFVKQQSPYAMLKSETLLHNQFVEHVVDCLLWWELKQLAQWCPISSLLEIPVLSEAIRW